MASMRGAMIRRIRSSRRRAAMSVPRSKATGIAQPSL
jgi:hypothetical protein